MQQHNSGVVEDFISAYSAV